MNSLSLILACLLLALLSLCSGGVEAYFHARWKYPPDGQLLRKRQKEIVKNAREIPNTPPLTPHFRKSRSYHFKYGPIFPESAPQYGEPQFSPPKWQNYWG